MFCAQSDHHTMMGSTEDPENGKAVAGSIFVAVAVYAVCFQPLLAVWVLLISGAWCVGVSRLLWVSSISAYAG